jgi:site-specific DNA recombinase
VDPERGGRPFTKTRLHELLTNVTCIGRVRYKQEIHAGEHAAIVDEALWQQVQTLLRRPGRRAAGPVRNTVGALLRGLLRCVPCGCAMTPTYSCKNQTTRYRYYVCCSAQKRGFATCPSKAIPAGAIEQLVLERIRQLGNEPALLQAARAQAEEAALLEPLDVDPRRSRPT